MIRITKAIMASESMILIEERSLVSTSFDHISEAKSIFDILYSTLPSSTYDELERLIKENKKEWNK